MKIGEMRMKTFLIVFGCVVITSYVFITISPTREQTPNESFGTLITQTHKHIKEFHVSKKKNQTSIIVAA